MMKKSLSSDDSSGFGFAFVGNSSLAPPTTRSLFTPSSQPNSLDSACLPQPTTSDFEVSTAASLLPGCTPPATTTQLPNHLNHQVRSYLLPSRSCITAPVSSSLIDGRKWLPHRGTPDPQSQETPTRLVQRSVVQPLHHPTTQPLQWFMNQQQAKHQPQTDSHQLDPPQKPATLLAEGYKRHLTNLLAPRPLQGTGPSLSPLQHQIDREIDDEEEEEIEQQQEEQQDPLPPPPTLHSPCMFRQFLGHLDSATIHSLFVYPLIHDAQRKETNSNDKRQQQARKRKSSIDSPIEKRMRSTSDLVSENPHHNPAPPPGLQVPSISRSRFSCAACSSPLSITSQASFGDVDKASLLEGVQSGVAKFFGGLSARVLDACSAQVDRSRAEATITFLLAPQTDSPVSKMPEFDALLSEIDGVCESQQEGVGEEPLLSPESLVTEVYDDATRCLAKSCTKAPRSRQEESPSPQQQVEEHLTLLLLREVVFLAELLHDQLNNAQPGAAVRQQRAALYRLLITIIFVIICRREPVLDLLELQENRKHRNQVMSTFLRCVLQPVYVSAGCETVLLSKVGLAHLDSREKKIPREIVDSVLKPALLKFCELEQLDLPLIVGLHSIVELFPTLFKEVFGHKILEMLKEFLDVDKVRQQFPKLDDKRLCEMQIYLLDFFRLFATTGAFSCEPWLPQLCDLVFRLESTWSTEQQQQQQPATFSEKPRSESERVACLGFRAPLCKLLCHYPVRAVDTIFERASGGDSDCQSQYNGLLKCQHATPIAMEYQSRSEAIMRSRRGLQLIAPGFAHFACNDQLSDVTLRLGPMGESMKAHRVVLASGSAYFQRLFTNGMAESHDNEVNLPDASVSSFSLILRFLYGENQAHLAQLEAGALSDLFTLADRYALAELQSLCEHHLSAKVSSSNVGDLLNLAVRQCQANSSSLSDSQLDDRLLGLNCCGDTGGESLLRACQSFILANLSSLSDELDLDDPILCQLLVSEHQRLLTNKASPLSVKPSPFRCSVCASPTLEPLMGSIGREPSPLAVCRGSPMVWSSQGVKSRASTTSPNP